MLLLALLCLIVFEGMFIILSRRYMLGAKVTSRSSHTHVTPTAGGVVTVVAALAGALFNYNIMSVNDWIVMSLGITLAIVSFVDDLHPLPALPRLIVQIIAVGSSFWWLCYPEALPLYILVVFGGVAFVNGLNFLDGICGMLSLYSAVLVGTLWWAFEYIVPTYTSSYLYTEWCRWIMLGIVTFMVFNFRDLVFSGDTGSVFLGFIAAVLLANLIIAERSIAYLVLVVVCFCDTGLTTFQRLLKGKNIFLPHRTFIYQLITSQWHIPHLAVSCTYAGLQLIISVVFFVIPEAWHYFYLIGVTVALSACYIILRRQLKTSEL